MRFVGTLALRWNFISLAVLDAAALLLWITGCQAGILLGAAAVAALAELFWGLHNALNDLKRSVPNAEYQKLTARGFFCGGMLGNLCFLFPLARDMSEMARRIYRIWRIFGIAVAVSFVLLLAAYGLLGDLLSFT
ncbi:MAG: hypothetical protein Q4C72_06150 [Eubacteriales bacterium]|nr:hypothetical protein [Eubacteriales bacterium]